MPTDVVPVPATPVRRSRIDRRMLFWAVAAALPWTWFLLRDRLGVLTDALAILLPVVVTLGVLAFGLLALRRPPAVVVALSLLLSGAVAVVAPWTPSDAGTVAVGTGVTVAGANVQDLPDAAPALLDLAPDVLVGVEMSDELQPVLERAYPYEYSQVSDVTEPDVAVYTRFPVRALDRPAGLPGVRVQIEGPAGPFVLYALHVPRPWFHNGGTYQVTVDEHQRIIERIAASIATETRPVLVLGDLNSTDRGRDYRALLDAGLVDAMRESWALPTSDAKWTPLLVRIDHVLVSRGWCGDRPGQVVLPRSDHRGVTATVGPCAGPTPAVGSAP